MKQLLTFLAFISFSLSTYAQEVYAVVLCNEGVLTGKYVFTESTANTVLDTISLSAARSIYAINAIQIDNIKLTDTRMQPVAKRVRQISGYQLTIVENGDTTTIEGTSESLSPEMVERLEKVDHGAKLFFEGITLKAKNEQYGRTILLLAFIVK